MTTEEQRALILEMFADFADKGDERGELRRFLEHVGFDLCCVQDIRELPAALLGHYRLAKGNYDVDRACMDLLTWPPISKAIFERMHQRRGV